MSKFRCIKKSASKKAKQAYISRHPKRPPYHKPKQVCNRVKRWIESDAIRGWAMVLITLALAWIAFYQIITTKSLNRTTSRAYIVCRSIPTIEGNMTTGEPLVVQINLINSGETAAMNVRSTSEMLINEQIWQTEPLPTEINYSTVVIGPSIPFSVAPAGLEMTESRIEGLKSGRLKLWLYTDIAYTDVFNEVCRTTICVRYNPTYGGFEIAEKYNRIK